MAQSFSYPSSSTVTVSGIGNPTGLPVPTDAIYIAGEDPSGNLEGLKTDDSGLLKVVQPTGQQTMANSSSVTIASDQTAVPISAAQLPTTLGAKTIANSVSINVASDQTVPVSAASLPLPSGAATAANQTTANNSLSSIDSKLATLGQKTMAGSEPIVIASDQSAIPVSQSGTWNIANISGSVTLPTGAATAANQTTANNSLASIDGKFGSLGQKTMSGSTPIVIASDQSVLPVNYGTSSSSSVTSVSGSASSVSLLASNSSRKSATIYNDSTAILYVKLGTTASTTSYTVQVLPGGYFELPVGTVYTGAIDGIWAAANGAARITELS